MLLMPTPKGLVFTVDLSKLADRELPEGSEMTVEEYRRTIEAPIYRGDYSEPVTIEWGDGTSEVVSSGTFPTHTYADGTGDVFTVTLRSATGKLPVISFNSGQSNATSPEKNLSYATVSIDHFDGVFYNGISTYYGGHLVRNCANIRYIDTRLIGSPQWNNLWYSAGCHGTAAPHAGELEQPVGSFCFDFTTGNTTLSGLFVRQQKIYGDIPQGFFDRCGHITNFESAFQGCIKITSIPSDLLDNCHGITSVRYIFATCQSLTGAPYIFWKEDGSIDTDRFPDLTADYAIQAYAYCPVAIRNQVPTAYGGTMTV